MNDRQGTTNPMRRRRGATTVAASVFLILGGPALVSCGADSEALGTGDDYSVMGALRQLPLPEGPGQQMITTGDISTASELAGLETPDAPGSEEALHWLRDLSGMQSADGTAGDVFIPFPDRLISGGASPQRMHELIGWSVIDATAFVALPTPPGDFIAVSGSFDQDTLHEGLTEVEDGIVTDKQGNDDDMDLGDDSTLDVTGKPTRLAHRDGIIAMSGSTPLVRAWLDDRPSVADQESFAAVARALDDHDVYSAVLAPPFPAGDVAISGGPMEDALPEQPFDVVGVGWAMDDAGAMTSSVYHFDSDEDAERAVDPLRELHETGTSLTGGRPFSDYFSVEDVVADGDVVVVTARPAPDAPVDLLFRALLTREILFASR